MHSLDLGDGNSLFGVLDGHGGDEVAIFCQREMAKMLVENNNYKKRDYGKAL